MKLVIVGALFFVSLAQAQPSPVTITVSGVSGASWRGISAEEAAGAQGLHMLYPAPNAGGLLAAILTHAAIVHGGRESERNARQAASDKILEPHAAAIAEMTQGWLIDRVSERVVKSVSAWSTGTSGDTVEGLAIEMRPSFALAPDRSTIVLDNAVKIHTRRTPVVTRFENVVRVISAPRDGPDMLTYWSTDGGRALKEESLALLAHSIDLAIRVAHKDPGAAAFRTQRYQFGRTEKMERGQPVAYTCGRIVLKTLREWLMSVPVQAGDGTQPCVDPFRIEQR